MNADSISLSKNELKEILNKGWMTHDAMWFYHCLQECGIEKTNKINKATIRDMATIEINRLQKALGEQNFDSFDKFKQFFRRSIRRKPFWKRE